VVKKKEGPL